MLEHPISQFFLPQSLAPPRHWPRLRVCMQNSLQFPVYFYVSRAHFFLIQTRKHHRSFLSFPFLPFCCFPFFSPPFFLFQIGHCALKWSVFPHSKQAALFSAIPHPDLLCSKSPFNCNPSILAKRACFSPKGFSVQFHNAFLHFPKTISPLKRTGQFLVEFAKISRFFALSRT